jgi:hypothetical protein
MYGSPWVEFRSRRQNGVGHPVEYDREQDRFELITSPERSRVLIARQNFFTALRGFISTDTFKRLNFRQADVGVMGYGMIRRVMRPFCGALNRMTRGSEQHALFFMSEEAIIAVQCWRAMLCLVRNRETEFTLTHESFTHTTPVIIAEFDASLSGAD